MLFRLFFEDFNRVLERVATQQTDCAIICDFNVHYGDDRASDGRASDGRASDGRASDDRASDDRACDGRASDDRHLTDLLREIDFQQHVTELTNVYGNILDLVITRPRDNTKHT